MCKQRVLNAFAVLRTLDFLKSWKCALGHVTDALSVPEKMPALQLKIFYLP